MAQLSHSIMSSSDLGLLSCMVAVTLLLLHNSWMEFILRNSKSIELCFMWFLYMLTKYNIFHWSRIGQAGFSYCCFRFFFLLFLIIILGNQMTFILYFTFVLVGLLHINTHLLVGWAILTKRMIFTFQILMM